MSKVTATAGVCLAMAGLCAPASAATYDGWIIQWPSLITDSDRLFEIGRLGYGEKRYYPLSNISWVDTAADTAAAPDTRFSPNYLMHAITTTPNDPQFTNFLAADELPLRYMNVETAWDYQTGSPNIRIGVFDTGIDTDNTDLKNKIDQAISFVTGDPYAGDKFGHGTNVASLIAAEANNGFGISGVCWGCRLVAVKVLSNTGAGVTSDLAEALRWAAANNIQIINMSLGNGTGGDPGSVLSDAIKAAYDQGILLIAAAGNEGANSVSYPARYDQVISVGAIDPTTGERAAFSNYKDGSELMAPGVDIFGDTFPNIGNVPITSGTSFAAPLAAGVAGLLWSEQPSLTRDEVRSRLSSSTKDLNTPGWDEQTAFGSVDAAAALRVAAFKVKQGKDVVSYPNPFRVRQGGAVTIRPPQDVGLLTVRVYTLDGRQIRTLSGTNEVQWDGVTNGGQTVAAGVYLFQASASNLRDEGRITVIDW